MESTGIILKPQIAALTVNLSAGVRKVVQLFLYYCSEVIRFDASVNRKVLKNVKLGPSSFPSCSDHIRYYWVVPIHTIVAQILQNTLSLQ